MKRRGWSYSGHKKSGEILILILILMVLSSSWSKSIQKEKVALHFLTDDSVAAVAYEVLDADSSLDIYKARIKTPVCENKVCYEVELIVKLICFNIDNLETETPRELINEIMKSGMVITNKIYKTIVSLEKKERWLKNDINHFKRYYKSNMKFN